MAKTTKLKPVKSVKTAKPAKTATEAGRVERRVKRQERLAKISTLSFAVEPGVRKFVDAQAKAEGMDISHYMQKLLENHVIASAAADDPLAQRLAAKRLVIDRAVELALALSAKGAFDEHFILTVVREAEKDPEFVAQYNIATDGANVENPRKIQRSRVSLNQQMGRLIKKAVGAKGKRKEKGAIARAQVQGALITSYTLLEKAA